MRKYVSNHPLYEKNSILPKKVIDDMLIKLMSIAKGKDNDENFRQIF